MADTETQIKLNSALRHVGTGAGTLFTLFGALQFVTPDQVAQLTAAVHDFNNSVISAYGALTKMWIILGPLGLLWMGKLGYQSSSVKALASNLLKIAAGPASPAAAEAQKAVIQATAAVAADPTIPTSVEAKNTLIAATISLPEVQTIVTDAKTAAESPSPSVVAVLVNRAS